jgi:CRISPR-associated protein Cas2
MLILVTYDVNVTSSAGQRRLRNISKTCLDYGMRVQNSVFECEVNMEQYTILKDRLLNLFDSDTDSLRFYHLGKNGRSKVQHFGAKITVDPVRDLLLL